MERVKYLILGAGPAGLTFAMKLKECREKSFLILEKEAEAGGLCRSVTVDGSPFDIGGGHFLDVRRPKVSEFLFRFIAKDEWNIFERDSRIRIGDMEIGHPLEANIWQFGPQEQEAYLASIANAGCNLGQPMPEKFVEWISWKLGQKIADDYMIPYNQKMFADELNELGTYWLDKLPNVSYEETLMSCENHEPYGMQPGHASFYYPKKYGYGEVWLRIAEELAPKVLYGAEVSELHCGKRQVKTKDGTVFEAENIVTTIPWKSFAQIIDMPKEMMNLLSRLKSCAIETRYVPKQLQTEAQWIYEPDPKVPWHRILVRHNFCPDSRGYWLETRKERIGMFDADVGDFDCTGEENYHYLNEYAYPLNTIGKPTTMKRLLAFAESRQIYGLGRWGEHSHYNSDAVVERAMRLAACLIG